MTNVINRAFVAKKNVINRALAAKKKLTLLFAALLMASAAFCLEQQTVSYTYPVYNTDGDPTSGIKEWKTKEITAIKISDQFSKFDFLHDWYVVTDTDVKLFAGAVCKGKVHLILADGAKLTVTCAEEQAGIQVSGEGNSLTIYGQTNQSGQLIVNGGNFAAGIGGGDSGSGSNITINGGMVTANGGMSGGAGIGGGNSGSGENITINGGIVTAIGRDGGAGIGGGDSGSGSNITINGGTIMAETEHLWGDVVTAIGGGEHSIESSNIKVATDLIIKADGNNPPTTVITNNGGDLAEVLDGKPYVTIEIDLTQYKADAITEINSVANAAHAEIDNASTSEAARDKQYYYKSLIDATVNSAKNAINKNATTQEEVDRERIHYVSNINGLKFEALEEITLIDAKATAIAEINSVANAAKAEIDKASTSEAAKDKQNYYKSLIDATVLTAKNAINNATTQEKVDNERTTYVSSINSKKFEALEEITLIDAKAAAIAEITSARQGIQNTEVNQWIDAAINDIQRGSMHATPGIDEIKEEILSLIHFVQIGKAEGPGNMSTPCTDCPAVKVKKGDTTITLYAPDEVNFEKIEAAE